MDTVDNTESEETAHTIAEMLANSIACGIRGGTDLQVLDRVSQNDDPTANQIGEATGMLPEDGNIYNCLNRLRALGLVESEGKRCKTFRLTPKGQQFADFIFLGTPIPEAGEQAA